MKNLILILIVIAVGGGYFWFKPDVDQFFHERKMAELARKHEEAKIEAGILREQMISDPTILSECSQADKKPRTKSIEKVDGGTKAHLDETNTIYANAGRVLIQTETSFSNVGTSGKRIEEKSYGSYGPANGTPLENYFASSVSHRLTCKDVGRLGDAHCKVVSTITIPEVSESCAKQMIDRIDL